MQRVLSVEQMRNADDFTINNLGISKETLVLRAGKAVASEITSRFFGGRVLVCVGKGNNGEDGRVIASVLSETHGFNVAVLNVDNGIFKLFDKKYDIIVDCIFGTGLNREVDGKYKTAIEKINESGAFVVSCDVPSGLNGNSGKPMGVAVKANLTVAVQEYKLGHFLNDGIDYSGNVVVKDIGISVWEDEYAEILNDGDVAKFFPKRKRNVNKGSFGKTAIVGGSKEFSGSVLLSLNALSALKTGAGYSNLTVPESLFSVYLGLNPECTMGFLKDDNGNVVFDKDGLTKLLSYDSIAIGMGMGKSKAVYDSIAFLLNNYSGRLLIDADGLNSLAEFGLDVLKNKKCSVVLTPHVGEFVRLSNIKKEDILSDTITAARNFAKEYGVTLVVKSAVTVISDGERTVINVTGTNALSKAGSGDTLSGLTAGLLARNCDVFDTVSASCYLFGRAAEIATSNENEYTVTVSDTVRYLGKAINSLF